MSPPVRKLLRTALPVGISLALLAWLATHIDLSASFKLLAELPAANLLAGFVFMLASFVFTSLRFWLLVKPNWPFSWCQSIGLNLLTILSAHAFGLLSDGLRVHYLMQRGASLRQGVDLTLADRLLSLWLLLLCSFLLLPSALTGATYAYPVSALGVITLLAGAKLASLKIFPSWLQSCLDIFCSALASPRLLLAQLVFSLLCCLALAGVLMTLATAIGFSLPLSVALAFAPLSLLASSVPFTYAGLGTREAAFAFGLPLLAPVLPEQALAMALGFAALVFATSLPGLLFIRDIIKKSSA